MAAQVPAALKSADVQRFANRAAQLEKYKPIVAYWLDYYVLHQILTRSLHTTSPEAETYAKDLMDKLETVKNTQSAEAAITDDITAKVYMEQFAIDTFTRAETAQNNDRVTKQTADTFQAAATFFDSLSIWGELDAESKSRSKFAKYHALRIARALKEGQDPNATNPKPELKPVASEDDDLENELKALESSSASKAGLQPSVEDVSETAPVQGDIVTSNLTQDKSTFEADVSPIDTTVSTSSRPVSVGGGYFPSAPATANGEAPATVEDFNSPHIDEETHIPRQATMADMMSPSIDNDTHIPSRSQVPAASATQQSSPSQYYRSVPPAQPPSTASRPVVTQSTPQVSSSTAFKADDDAVMAAQKHAKWAISALNFEDVPTAVRELRIALQSLGGL